MTGDIIHGDCLDVMAEMLAGSAHLVVTSPPYNVGKEYENDLTHDGYVAMLRSTIRAIHRVLAPGGRICVNIANVNRKPYIPYDAFVKTAMLDAGFLMRGDILWDKGDGATASTAWGSWCSATNPVLRDIHEYIIVGSKGSRQRNGGTSTLFSSDFTKLTKSIWRMATENPDRVNHPAPFPLELPRRLIKLYSFREDVVLDPFCGSGTTCLAAKHLGRSYIGIDKSEEYCEIVRRRVSDCQATLEATK